MHPSVRLVLPDGSRAQLAPGDIVGRMPAAALLLDDGRVSEAHALVSLRGGELQLLALRGMFAVDGQPAAKTTLAPGQRLTFAEGLELVVEAVTLPAVLPALEGDGLPRQVLPSSASLLLGPPPALVPGSRPEAPARLWTRGETWRLQIGEDPPVDLAPGAPFLLGGRTFRLTEIRVDRAGTAATEAVGRVADPLRIVASWDTVTVHRAGRPPVLLSGIAARLVSTLASVPAALSWEGLASEVWPGDNDRDSLRRRLDVALSRLRARLRDAGLRTDLVRASGAGFVELALYDGDTVVDQS